MSSPRRGLDLAEAAFAAQEDKGDQRGVREALVLRADRLIPELRKIVTQTKKQILFVADFINKCEENMEALKPESTLSMITAFVEDEENAQLSAQQNTRSEDSYNDRVAREINVYRIRSLFPRGYCICDDIRVFEESKTNISEKMVRAEEEIQQECEEAVKIFSQVQLMAKQLPAKSIVDRSAVFKTYEYAAWLGHYTTHSHENGFCDECANLLGIQKTGWFGLPNDQDKKRLHHVLAQKVEEVRGMAEAECARQTAEAEQQRKKAAAKFFKDQKRQIITLTKEIFERVTTLRQEIKECAEIRLAELNIELETYGKKLAAVLDAIG